MASVSNSLEREIGHAKSSTLNRESPVVISFSGIDGSGKSTQIAKLLNRLRDAGLVVSQLTFWDDVAVLSRFRADVSHKLLHGEGGVGTPENPVNRNDKNVRTWYLTLPRCVLHFLDSLCLRQKLRRARANAPDVIVCDRYIFDQLATLPLDRAWARACARLILQVAPIPDVAYLLDVEPEIARARKPEYPLDFMHRYRASYLQLRDLAGMAMIEPMSQDEVHEAITTKLQDSTNLRLRNSTS
ncbi:MAG: thymidylate kinase [Acidobacteriaceae bacterium]|nr:thymidylate kinase [Acidobacteriaceae bacterium]